MRSNAAICWAGSLRRRSSRSSDCRPVSLPAAARVSATSRQKPASSMVSAEDAEDAEDAAGARSVAVGVAAVREATVVPVSARMEPRP